MLRSAASVPTIVLHHRAVQVPTTGGSVLSLEELPDEEEMDMYDVEIAGAPADSFVSLKLGGLIELGRLPAMTQFIILALGMFAMYVSHAYFQEKIFSYPGFSFGFFVSFFDFVMFTVLAGVQLVMLEGSIPRRAPLGNFFILSVSLALSIGCGFASLRYLNYPTKVLFKSGKIIPTMLLGRLAFGRMYSVTEYIAAVLLCSGLAFFTLAQASVSPSFHVVGVALVSVSAVAEAAVGNLQENVLTRYKCVLLEIVFWSNLFSSAVVFGYLVASGELFSGFEFVWQRPDILQTIIAEATVGYIGVFFYLGIVQRFGVAICIGVSALRKVVTICLSFIVFPKPFTFMYVVGGALVFASIALSARAKSAGHSSAQTRHTKVHHI